MRRAASALSLCALGLASGRDARALDAKPSLEVGGQAALTGGGHVTRDRVYALGAIESTFGEDPASGASFAADGAVRAYVGDSAEIALRALSLRRTTEHARVTIGVQEIAWGETFGFPIADLVGPHDLRDPLFLDLDWIRLPVAAANAQLTWDALRLQLVATPFPRTNLYPERRSPLDPLPAALDPLPLVEGRTFPVDRLGRDTEAGARASYLLPFGLDLTALYFFHWNRTPVFEIVPVGGAPALRPVIERTHTVGLSFSQPAGDVVLRGDALAHLGEPIQDASFAPPARGTHVESVLGADLTTSDEWTLGAQAHFDAQRTEREATARVWASARVARSLLAGDLVPELFAFRGIGNGDAWVQPKVTVRFAERFSVSVRGDFVWGEADDPRSPFGHLREQQRVFASAKATF